MSEPNSPTEQPFDSFDVVVIGGGTAGITVAARLRNESSDLSIALIDPAKKHYYQPLWTLVGGGIFPKEDSERDEADFIPHGVEWIQQKVVAFAPDANSVSTDDGRTLTYRSLVVCPGIQVNWDGVKGLQESIGKNGVCSNYSYEHVESTWENIRNFRGGRAIFTQPAGAVKCGGAPQKICYLAEDYFRKHGIRDKCEVVFTAAGPRIFAVEKYAKALTQVVERKGVIPKFRHNLVEIRGEAKQAVYKHMETDNEIVLDYEMIHVTPPMSAPNFVTKSPLAGEGGWVDVDKYTCQHTRFSNVFGLGDASSLPTSKTGAAIRKQAPTVVANLLSERAGRPLEASYDGYTSCPVVTGYDSLILAEFDYDKQPCESFPFDQSKERLSMMMLKKYGLPRLYWHGMLRGRA